jgi:DNA-binding Lrp family transcriptional regulator
MKENKSKILSLLLRNLERDFTITLLARELKLSRTGIWKILKKLEKDKLVSLLPLGVGKTGIYNIKLNWENPLLEKNLSLILAEEAIKNQRWLDNFKELEGKISFLIIYGSILHSPKEANDIDLLSIFEENNSHEIDNLINKIQKTQIKKIHFLNLSKEELKAELKRPNKAFIDAIKKGVILFGQEKFIKFIENLNMR